MKKILTALLLSCMFIHTKGQNKPDGTIAAPSTRMFQLPADYDPEIVVSSVKSLVPKKAVNSVSLAQQLPVNDKNEVTVFYDGLGRPIQINQRAASGYFYNDVVTPIIYDTYGDNTLRPLPFSENKNGKFTLDVFSKHTSYYSSGSSINGLQETSAPYFEVENANLDPYRTQTIRKPGASKIGASVGAKSSFSIDGQSNEIAIWKLDGNDVIPTFLGYHNTNDLLVNTYADEDGRVTKSYYDRQKRLIATRTSLSTTTSTGNQGWLTTHYIYDEHERIRYVLPPKAIELLATNNWTITQSITDNLCYKYLYDALGRNTRAKSPGIAEVSFLYDLQNRPVLIQDGNLRASNRWKFIKYDDLGRSIMTGIFKNSSNMSAVSIQGNLSAINVTPSNNFLIFLKYSVLNNTNVNNNSLTPNSVIPDAEIYEINCYDYSSYVNSVFSYAGTHVQNIPAGVNSVNSVYSTGTQGKLVGSFTRILDGINVTPKWQSAAYYYDANGRLIQVQSKNAKEGRDTSSFRYDFEGKLLFTQVSQNNPSATVSELKNLRVLTMLSYDRTGRQTSIFQKLNNDINWRKISFLQYAGIGDKVTYKAYGSNAETQAYGYRIWGDLESINKSFCETGTGSRFFGEILSSDYGFKEKYNDQISGMRWRLKGSSSIQRAYGYKYDLAGRLNSADYTQLQSVQPLLIPIWTNLREDYTANSMQYDANGNLLKMNQYGKPAGVFSGTPVKIDELNYQYKNGGASNQLNKVTDAITTTNGFGDFTEPNSQNSSDYDYDLNGNMTRDYNKGIPNILYDYNNKPVLVSFSNSTIKFTYNANGELLSKQITEPGNVTTIDYIGNLEYVNNVLISAEHPEGRMRPVKLTLADGTTRWEYEYDYFIKDHQGNVRSIVTEVVDNNWWQETGAPLELSADVLEQKVPGSSPSVPVAAGYTMGWREYSVTNEPNNAPIEESQFDNIASTRDAKPSSYNPQDQYATRLNADQGKTIGPSIMLQVSAGDKVDITTGALYETGGGTDYSHTPLEQLVSALLNALSGGGAYQTINEGGAIGDQTYNSLVENQFLAAMQDVKSQNETDEQKPQAFLNYILLDENLSVVEENSGFVQIRQPNAWDELVVPEMEFNHSGTLIVYLSNESRMNVHFDNLHVRHYKGQLLEENHYYPYGLTITHKALTTAPNNNTLFGGKTLHRKEFSNGSGLNWYDYGARMYDPQIGRWHVPDPLADVAPDWSPYRYGFCNPVRYGDPTGMYEEDYDDDRDNDRDDYEMSYSQEAGGSSENAGNNSGRMNDLDMERADALWEFVSSALEGEGDWGDDEGRGGRGRRVPTADNTGGSGRNYAAEIQAAQGWHWQLPAQQTMYDPDAGKGAYTDAVYDQISYGVIGLTSLKAGVQGNLTFGTVALDFAGLIPFGKIGGKVVKVVAAKGGTTVYTSVSKGVTQYVGITNNLARRSAEHLASKGINIQPLMQGLSRADARAVEQALIEIHGLGKNGGTLLNKINSISPTNPAYGSQLQRGYDLLKTIGY